MSDTSWGCQSLQECAEPTWDHALGQLVVAAGMWLMFLFVGICWTSLMPFIDIDFRSTFGRYQYGLASVGLGAGLCLTGIYMLQCLTYLHRSVVHFVDPLLHAFEMLGTLISLLDIGARWAYACCDGFWQLIAYSFKGTLIVDCLVSTATVGLGISAGPPGEEQRTWWSMSFLASIHVFRCLSALSKADTGKSNSNLKRQVAYSLVTLLNGMYLFASIIMTFEILGPRPGSDAEDKLPGTQNPWTMADGLTWAVSLVTLMGNNARHPVTTLGQVVGMIGLLVTFQQIAKITPIINAVTGIGSFVGRYPIESRSRGHGGHTIILGSPTAKTLIEFLFEYYHVNHFTGGLDFEREASDTVVFLEDAKTLAHLRRMLDLKDASLFQSRVFLIKGTAFQPYDCRRVCTAQAKRVVVLPDMQTSDVDRDDKTNIMRTYAMCAAGPKVMATCVLHSAQHQGAVLSGSTPNSYFVSIDAIKMGMMGKACQFPGAIAMICNLCVSVGQGQEQIYSVRRHWLSDYENGLDMELYEVPLSMGYAGYTFHDAFEDIQVRTKGTVYLIGLTDIGGLHSHRGVKKGEREVLINPGPDFELRIVEGRMAGVFVASELDAIEQVPAGQDPKISRAKMPKKLPTFEKAQNKVVAGKKKKEDPLRLLAMTPQSDNEPAMKGPVDMKEKGEQMMEIKKDMDDQYEEIMLKIKKRFLEQGLHPDLVAGATHSKDFARRFPRSNLAQVQEEALVDEEEERKGILSAAGEALDKFEKKKQELEKLEALLERCRRDALGERRAPKSLRTSGGHVLVCLTGDTEVASIPVGSVKLTGAPIGIDVFMKSLRDDRLELSQGSQPAVVFLGELQPADWHKICHHERVYYMAGSPLRAEDLLRAGLETCCSVVVARMHSGTVGQATKTADARVVLAATMATYMLPFEKVTPIVTDHAYSGSCELLPPERVFIEEGPQLSTASVGPPPELPQALTALLKGAKALARSIGLDGKPPPTIDVAILDGGQCVEKYEDMEVHDIKYHPRYMRGQVFHTSVVASMVASSMYNPNLITMVDALMEAPMLMIEVPKVFFQSRYNDFALWLMRERGLLALALYQSAEASQSSHTGDFLDAATPTHDFVYTCPPGSKTLLVKTDRVIVAAPGTEDTRPTDVGTSGMKAKMKKAIENVHGSGNAAGS